MGYPMGLELHSILGWFEEEQISPMEWVMRGELYVKREVPFNGLFIYDPATKKILDGDLKDGEEEDGFGKSRIVKGTMSNEELVFMKRYHPTYGMIEFRFNRDIDNRWVGRYYLAGVWKAEAVTALIDRDSPERRDNICHIFFF